MQPTQKLSQSIRDYKNGNADAFNILYEESNKYIYTCIYKVMFGNDNAQDIIYDIMQDTYVEISKSIEQLADEERFLSWAGTIATRKCYAYLKKNKKYVLLNEEDDTFDALADSDDIIPEEVMQDREKQRLIREIIENQLTEMQKLCIIAYYYNEQKQSEIAQELGIPENTVKTNLSRAKAKIKEGVLDLEKNKGTKLYSFAPLFVLLFTEDIMAAEVPAEVGVSVLSGVAETTKVASVVETATAGTAGVTTSAATKVGMLGKIAAASVKTKVMIAVATVSVAGTVGGGAMIASQNGLFGNASAVSEEQTLDAGQELEEDQVIGDVEGTEEVLTSEIEEQTSEEQSAADNNKMVIETVALSGEYVTGTEIRYADGTSDYEIYYADPDLNKTIHYRMTGTVSNLVAENWNGYCHISRTTKDENGNYVRAISMYVAIMVDETYAYASKPDEFYGSESAGGAVFDPSLFKRVETEKDYRVYTAGTREEFGVANWKFYNLGIDDYATGKSFQIMLRGTQDFSYQELLDVLNCLEIVEVEGITTEVDEPTTTEELDASYIEYTYYSSMRDETVHFRVAHVPDEVWNGDKRDASEALVRRSLIEHEKDVYEKFYFRLFPLGNIATSGLDLKNMSDEQIGAYTGGVADYATLEKIETEDAYMVFVEYDIELDLEPFKGYDLYINDYRTGKAYELKLNRTLAYYDSQLALSILKSFEILE